MALAPTSENPLQTVARRSVVAAEEQGRKRERATGAVRKIEGIMARNKVEVSDKSVPSAREGQGVTLHYVALVVSLWLPVGSRTCRVDWPEIELTAWLWRAWAAYLLLIDPMPYQKTDDRVVLNHPKVS